MPPFLWMSQIFSEHLQPLCCPSHPRFLNSLMHLQNPFPLVSMFLYASSITLIVELRYSIALTLCWRYYYDPRCLRGSSSNLAMICVPSVMILAIILESIPWCYLVVGILFPGFWTRDSPYLLHVDSFARSFRLLVTFALVLDVRGIPFFQILWTAYGRCSSLIERSQSECSRWVLDSTLWLCQFYLSAWVIRKKYVEFVRHAKPCIHNSENRMFLWVVPL